MIGFRDGLPVTLDGEELGLVEIIQRIAEIACRNGVGILDHIEDRVVGLKVRDIYEVPAAEVILTAHRELEKLVCTGRENALKPTLDALWAAAGLRGALVRAAARGPQRVHGRGSTSRVEGEITMRLYKGSATAVARRSPNAIYDRSLATFNADASFSQGAAPGFIELFSLQSRTAYQIAAGAGARMRRGGPPMLPVDPAAVPPFARVERGPRGLRFVAGRPRRPGAASRPGRARCA